MKKLSLFFLILFLSLPYFCLTQRNIVTDIFIVKYSETYEQPLFMYYSVKCPQNGVSRSGLDFKLFFLPLTIGPIISKATNERIKRVNIKLIPI